MSAADVIVVGRGLPRIGSVTFRSGCEVAVSWAGGTRGGATEVVDLTPLVSRLRFFAPLRDDDALRRSVHLIEEGAAIAWGEEDEIDMAARSVLRLAEEAGGSTPPADDGLAKPRTDDRATAA